MESTNSFDSGSASVTPQELSERLDGCGVGIHRTAVAQARLARPSSGHRSARGSQRHPLLGAQLPFLGHS